MSLREEFIQQQATQAARGVTSGTIAALPATFDQTSHGANRVRPPNQREIFLAACKTNPKFQGLTHQEREEMWKKYKKLAEAERVAENRGDLGIQAPTINLNTCSIDKLERVPKLNQSLRKAIILKRNNLPGQRFTSWDDIKSIQGIGSVILESMKVFCMDPATSTAVLPQQPVADTSGTAASSGSQGNTVLVVGSSTDLSTPVRTSPLISSPAMAMPYVVPALPPQLMTMWTQSTGIKPGEMYQDSGCARSCAGPDVHRRMHEFLQGYNIEPVQVNKQEEFIFGNNQVEMSDCSFIYPVFLDEKLVGAIDIARLPVPCPGLYSKKMMKQWKHVLDFDAQVTHIKEFNLTYPFKDTVPILDIFQMPSELRIKDIPPRFRPTTNLRPSVYGSSAPPRSVAERCLQVSTSGTSLSSDSSPPPLVYSSDDE